MKRVAVLLCLVVVLPLRAALLEVSLGGEFEAGFTPPIRGPFELSFELHRGPTQPSFTDLVAPNGTIARDYFVGTELFSEGVPTTSPEELSGIRMFTFSLGGGDPLNLKPFALTQSISMESFNRYAYSLDLFAMGDAFIFFAFNLILSPAPGVDFWDRAFVESLQEPIRLLGVANILDASGFMVLSQLGLTLGFDRVAVTDREAAVVAVPASIALAGTAMLVLWLVHSRFRSGRTSPTQQPVSLRERPRRPEEHAARLSSCGRRDGLSAPPEELTPPA